MQADLASQGYIERLVMIRTFPGLGGVNSGALSLMAERSRLRRFKVGEALFVEGAPVTQLFLIVDGKVAVRRRGITIRSLGTREVLGALSAFARSTDGPEAVAETDTLTLELENRDTAEIFQDNFDMLLIGLSGIARENLETRKVAGVSAGFTPEFCPLPPPREKLSLADRVRYLAGSSLFSGMRLDKVALLARESHEIRFAEGSQLWSTGSESGKFLLCLAGALQCSNSTQSFYFGVGEAAGLLESLAGVPRWHNAVAASSCVVLELDVTTLLDVFEDDPPTAMRLLGRMSEDLIALRKSFANAKVAA